jgi:serine/threonine protein kinase
VKTPRRSTFERCAIASGLLTQEQLDKGLSALARIERALPAPPTAPQDQRLAEKLIDLEFLNRWQAKQLLDGRTKFNLGPYWIIDSIGRGGMGQVFKAEHGVLGRIVAVKVLPRSRSTPEAIASFTREIRTQGQLDHPNLVRAFDAGMDGNVYYLVTEYVPGSDLRKLVRGRGPLPAAEAARIVAQIARGLQHAHERGLIHRDVKPGNILVTPEGHAKLSDLGLVGPMEGGKESDPRYGRIVGTADYLSPDHIQSPWEPKPAWDIYSLGCALYYAVTGKVPFPGGTTADKAQAHVNPRVRPLDPRRLNPAIPEPFLSVLADMMAKNPAERLQSAAEVAQRLGRWADEPARSSAAPSRIGSPFGPDSDPAFGEGGYPLAPVPGVADTEAMFPEVLDVPTRSGDSASQLSQTTHPIAAATDETQPDLAFPPSNRPRGSLLAPLAVLVAFPLAIISIALLVRWLVK